MDRVAVFVDAGYLFAAGAEAVFGRKLKRSEIRLDQNKVVEQLREFATSAASLPLLRIYWYDGTSGVLSTEQIALAKCADIKMRLGAVNSFGQQKGVDSLIITDMIGLARNRTMADAVLLSGDEDVRVGMQQAQEWGVRIHLLGIDPGRHNQSPALAQEADTCATWTAPDVEKFLSVAEVRPKVPIASVAVIASPDVSKIAVGLDAFLANLSEAEIQTCGSAEIRSVPADIDAKLLTCAATTIRRRLTAEEKRDLRKSFMKECRSRLAAASVQEETA